MASIYTKPYQKPEDIVESHLVSRNLSFSNQSDKDFASQILNDVSWYKFKAYLYPYLDHPTKNYKANITFSHGLELYRFDHELRSLCNFFILKVETKAKSRIDHSVSSFTNDPFWYLDDDLFTHRTDLTSERGKFVRYLNKSNMEFAEHYRANYISNKASFRKSAPFWITAELITFDSLVRIIDGLLTTKFDVGGNNSLRDFAISMGARSFSEIKSWMKALKELRNRCSHNSRTWNSNYRLPSGFVDNHNTCLSNSYITHAPTRKNKIYTLLVVLHLTSKDLSVSETPFKDKLKELLQKYSHIPILLDSMGIPSNWESDPVWA